MKNFIIWIVVLLVVGGGIYFGIKKLSNEDPITNTSTNIPTNVATTTENKSETVIGKSVQNRDIVAYHFGTGDKEIMFIGGIHGGYEWNTSLVAYEAIDYLKANPTLVPANVKVTIIPVLNPDGLNKVVTASGKFSASQITASAETQVSGRFNGNNVDLNRNFDCDWQTNGTWQNKTVSGGSRAFSEPESLAIKNYVEAKKPVAIITWYSSAGGVYASSCHNGVSAETNTLTKTFADASGYKAYQNFDFYEITGDMVNWFAKNNIPAVSVLLTNHTDTEWTKNQKGIDAVLKYYAQ